MNVTYPADLSFRTAKVLEFFPFAPDSLMLDHRIEFSSSIGQENDAIYLTAIYYAR